MGEIKIHNCNNIKNGEIHIEKDKLNILYGKNGTGKSTIARAIYLSAQGKDLLELCPYGIKDEANLPNIDGVEGYNVAIFDDNYVKQYIYQPDSVVKDTFEVLIRSKEYDDTKQKIDDTLHNIKSKITTNEEISLLQKNIGILIKNIEITGKTSKLAKRKGGIKGVLNGKGAYFNPPTELSELKPFFEEETVVKWATWRLQGYNEFGEKGKCPYCSAENTEKTKLVDKVFANTFDKASIEYASEISKALEALKQYVSEEKVQQLLSLFGTKDDVPVLEAQLTKLGAEARYLHDRLTAILDFNGSSVDRENIAELEETLKNMEVKFIVCDSYFVSDDLKQLIQPVNNELQLLLEKVNSLKAEIGKYNKYIQDRIRDRKDDINEFLKLAGFRYIFDVEIDGENSARALLKFVLPDGTPAEVKTQGNSLSWGEKHSFALILFMFDAIRNNSNLIILDDPISSFDSNKKYAIMNRLFKTGCKDKSLYERTVLMLTHDFEPIIDYIQTHSGRQSTTSVCAKYFENIDGDICSSDISQNGDIMSSVVLFKELAKSSDIDIAARIGCLRKYIEHQYSKPREESVAYNILSSLIHGREKATLDIKGEVEITSEAYSCGEEFIKQFIDDFNYESMLDELKPQKLIERYNCENSWYIKMLILRAYIEQDAEARERMRSYNDVLRKYVDETYHIENDYIYSLDVRKFNIVPDNYIKFADAFITSEIEK